MRTSRRPSLRLHPWLRLAALAPALAAALLLSAAFTVPRATAGPPPARDFHFAILGDRTGSAVPGVYEARIAEVASFDPDLILTVGDQIEGYTEDATVLATRWDEYGAILAPLAKPVHACAGNHDIGNEAQERLWTSRHGHGGNYSFDHVGVHFTFLDTGRWESSEEWLAVPGHREWLERDLDHRAPGRFTVVVYHKPFWYETLAEGKPDPLHAIFLEHGVDAVYNGHFHRHASARYDGIAYTIVPSSGGAITLEPEWGGFHGWVWGTVRGDRLTWTVVSDTGIYPAGEIRVEDLKFRDGIDGRIVALDPLVIGEGAGDLASGRCALRVRNVCPSGEPLHATLAWRDAPGWSIEPARSEISIGSGDEISMQFEVRRTGRFYPLPSLAFDYPYRDGRCYRYERALPALRVQVAQRLDSRPVIDGDLRDPAWDKAGKAGIFGSEGGGASVAEPVGFRFGYDGEALYLAARCKQDDPASITATATSRDGPVHLDDCVGYFLCPETGDSSRILQVYVNAAGTLMDSEIVWLSSGGVEGLGNRWNGEVEAATSRHRGGWSAEMRIPFSTLGASAPASGTTWRVNFRRKEPSRKANADWQVPIDFDPSRFGYLVFEERGETGANLPLPPAR